MRLLSILSTLVLVNDHVLGAPAPVIKRNLDVNKFLAEISKIFHVDILIEDACGLITNGEELLADTFDISTTSNSNGCADVTLLFARGTCDPGNIGALVGAPFVDALRSAVGPRSLNVQGIAYPASVDGYLSDDPAGGQTMAGVIRDTMSSCPNTKVVLGGYSQGGLVVHNAAADAGPDVMSKVSAVVIFGDPGSHTPVENIDPSRVKIICHAGDDICDDGDLILLPHLTYAGDAGSAAQFVQSQI